MTNVPMRYVVSLDWPVRGNVEIKKRRIIELGASRLVDLDALKVVDLDEGPSRICEKASCSGATSSKVITDLDVPNIQQQRKQLIHHLHQHAIPTRKLKRTVSADVIHAKEDALKQLFFQISELERKAQRAHEQSASVRPRSLPVAAERRTCIPVGSPPRTSVPPSRMPPARGDETGTFSADGDDVLDIAVYCRVPGERTQRDMQASAKVHVLPVPDHQQSSSEAVEKNETKAVPAAVQLEIERLIAVLTKSTSTPKKKEESARILCEMACDELMLACMVMLGVVPPLVDLMRSCKQTAQEQAARTLRRLAYQNPPNKEAIVAAGAVPPLTFLLAPERALSLRDQACAVLGSLAVDCPKNKTIIGEAGAVPWIVDLLVCGHPSVMEQAARTLWHLAVNHPENKAVIARAHAIPPLVRLLQEGSGELSEQARGALTSLTMGNITNKAAVRRAAAVAGCCLEDAGLKQHAEHVLLHVYDVGGDGSLKYVNGLLRNVGAGAFHAGVEVYGEEWSFGHRKSQITGVFCYKPRQCMSHAYRETVEMGFTSLSHIEVLSIIARMAAEWPGEGYDFITNNCCHFCSALCVELGTSPTPEWVTSLAGAGATLINGYRAVVAHAQSAANSMASTTTNDDISIDRGILTLAAQGVGVVANTLEHIAGDGASNGFVQAISKTSDRLESALVRNGVLSETNAGGLDVKEVALECVFADTCKLSELNYTQKIILLPVGTNPWSIGVRHQPALFYHLVPDDEARDKLILDSHFLLSWDPPDLYITKITSRPIVVNGERVPMPPHKLKLPPRARIGLCEPTAALEVNDNTADDKSTSPFLVFEVQLRDSSRGKEHEQLPPALRMQLPSHATRQPTLIKEDTSVETLWLDSQLLAQDGEVGAFFNSSSALGKKPSLATTTWI